MVSDGHVVVPRKGYSQLLDIYIIQEPPKCDIPTRNAEDTAHCINNNSYLLNGEMTPDPPKIEKISLS